MCAKKCDKKDQSTELFGMIVIGKSGIHVHLGFVKQCMMKRGLDTRPIHVMIQYIQFISPTSGGDTLFLDLPLVKRIKETDVFSITWNF